MGLLLDPRDPVEHVIEDVTFAVKVLTSREYVQLMKHVAPLQPLMDRATADGGTFELDLSDVGMFENFAECLLVGLAGYKVKGADLFTPFDEDGLDRIPFATWSELFGEILKVNNTSEEDSKNARSPSQ